VHRELFPDRANPPIKLEEFEHYLYWHNRGWGSQGETVSMVVSNDQRSWAGWCWWWSLVGAQWVLR
jgi:hypothetical protein